MILVKVGGGEAVALAAVASDLAELGQPAVVVHGANAFRDRLAQRLGVAKRTLVSESGVESVFTDDEALEVLTMAYAGAVNKRLVSLCQRMGVNAIGLTGLDGGLVRGRRNRGIRISENGRRRLLQDLSGKPAAANVGLLRLLLDAGYTPLLTVPILDEEGHAVNSENDDVLALLQRELAVDEVVQLIEAPGLLRDRGDPESLVRRISADEIRSWTSRASGRFRRKLMALSRMMEAGCRRIAIADGRVEAPLRRALSGEGTTVEP